MRENQVFLEKLKTNNTFIEFFTDDTELKEFKYKNLNEYLDFFWKKYCNQRDSKENSSRNFNSTNGKVFETIFAFLLDRERKVILSMDEEVDNVKHVKPDFIVQGKNNSKIFFSLKTSIRERWKQADWEAIKYKEKYSNSLCYIIMIDDEDNEFTKLSEMVSDSELNLRIDGVFMINSIELNSLFEEKLSTEKL